MVSHGVAAHVRTEWGRLAPGVDLLVDAAPSAEGLPGAGPAARISPGGGSAWSPAPLGASPPGGPGALASRRSPSRGPARPRRP